MSTGAMRCGIPGDICPFVSGCFTLTVVTCLGTVHLVVTSIPSYRYESQLRDLIGQGNGAVERAGGE